MNHYWVRQVVPNCAVFGRPGKSLLTNQCLNSSRRKLSYEMYDGPIVISGISGRFPMSANMEEFKDNLYAGLEMTSSVAKRWQSENYPERFGFLTCLDRFDASFFNMTPQLAHQADPQVRLLLEVTFEAMLDAGMNPTELRGSRIGVFCGTVGGEAMDHGMLRYNLDLRGYGALGQSNFMIPARISFAFDLRGPSCHLSTACSSSFTAVEAAVNSIVVGKCEAALVTGSNVLLNPYTNLDMMAMNVLARDGRCKAFDVSADGFARAEAVVGIFIQKEKDARRRYATIVNIRSNSDGFKHEGLMCPDGHQQELLLKEAYEQAGVDPSTISYIEAHGTGTPTGDPQEIEAIHRVLCKSVAREQPLLLGSVKSNMGHAESAAGLCGVAKTIIAIQQGSIPPNLHFKKPKTEQEHLFDGSIKIPTEAASFDRGLVGISSFGIGGTNCHMILEPGPVRASRTENQRELPVLIPFSGRKEDQVMESIKQASANARNPEFLSLLHTAFHTNIPGHPFRGVGLLRAGSSDMGPEITVANSDTVGHRPVWIIFPGMGSQWNQMGKDLMKIEPFSESVGRSRATLKNLGVDLDDLLEAKNEAIFNDIRLAVLAINSIQVAIWDTLKELQITADGFIGHSTGELLCAYADDCFTAEEMLLVTDARGRAFKESQKVIGCMASVGMSADEVKVRLPPGVELACNNAAQNVTVSGELEAVTRFTKRIKDEGRFATVVNSCGIAAHSKHVQDAADLLKKYVADIIEGDRARSSRWISTSIPESEWESPLAKLASPEYLDNNLRAPVLFYEALQHVPANALVIEVSPKGFFQALLKESLPKGCAHVAPMSVKAADKLSHFYQSVGQIYLSGADVHMARLYPSVAFPVASNTPSISHLVQWDHDQSWKTHIVNYPVDTGRESVIDLQHPNHAAIRGHKIEDRILYPATGYMVLAWAHFAESLGKRMETTGVVLSNVQLKQATILNENLPATLLLTIQHGSGRFEFCQEDDQVVVTGSIGSRVEKKTKASVALDTSPKQDSNGPFLPLNTDDIYKEFRLRGYNYSGLFQGIHRMDNEGKWADVAWIGNWISFLDTLLQTTILSMSSRNLALPTDFESIAIDPIEFFRHLPEASPGSDHPLVRVTIDPSLNIVSCLGVEIKGLTATVVARKGQRGNLAYEKYAFCPFVETSNLDLDPHIWEMVDLVLENNHNSDLKVVDVFTDKSNSLARLFTHILTLKPLRVSDVTILTLASEAEGMEGNDKKIAAMSLKETREELVPQIPADLIFLDDVTLFPAVAETLKPAGFLFLNSQDPLPQDAPAMVLVWQKTLPSRRTLTLFRKTDECSHQSITHVPITSNSDFSWIRQLQQQLRKPAEETARIYITAQNDPNSGILGLVNCLRQEQGGDRIRCIFDPEKKLNLDFTAPDSTLQSILSKDLAVNVLKNNAWGSYRHIPSNGESCGVIQSVEHAYIGTLTPGDLTSLRWIESPLGTNPPPPQNDMKLYNISYAALNFRDVLLATKTIPIEPHFSYSGPYMGFEFSGYDENGGRVMGLAHGNALATSVVVSPRFVWQVPPSWTLAQAATVPVAYATVLYAFHTRARLESGQSVLIHAGSGGVGQAAISVALAHGCEVFTTVGTQEKRDFIRNNFPQIQDDHIGNSRDVSFEGQFMQVTKGRGVDIVLNSLADDKLMATVRCLAVNGKFLEIGVHDAFRNTPLGMRPFLKNIEFHGVELYHVMQDDKKGYERELRSMMDSGISSGVIRPLPMHVFQRDQIQDAFRFMASGKHMGKLLIEVRDETKPPQTQPLNLPALRRCYFPQDKVYIIVGGLGGLGMELANWLVERGARNLILTSRSGLTNGYQSLGLRKWRQDGVKVETPAIDLSHRGAAESFIKQVASKHVVGGVFNSALVLRDDLFLKQTEKAFKEVCAPKATVTENLDALTRKYCPKLDYFVVFSSSACGRGNSDQTNYGWANSVMERICENRMADGLHGLAIQWGVVGQVGIVAETLLKSMDGSEILFGTHPQTVDSCLKVLDVALQQNLPIVSSTVVAERKNVRKLQAGGLLLSRLANIFGINDMDSVSPSKKLSELGMDSLVAIELGQILERDYDLQLSKAHLRSLTINDLKAIEVGNFRVQGAGESVSNNSSVEDGRKTAFKLHDKCLVKLKSDDGVSMQSSLFIVHGIGGNCEIFRPLASKLCANVYGFQYGQHLGNVSVPALAQTYISELKKVQRGGPYWIVGYSAGCAIAFEMASQLRTRLNDAVSKLILMDGCPTWAGNSVSHAIQTDFKRLVLAANEKRTAIDNESVQRYLLLGDAIASYIPRDHFYGDTVLLQAKAKSDLSALIPNEDYNVSLHCRGTVNRHAVEGDHETFLEEEYVQESAGILNELLKNIPIIV